MQGIAALAIEMRDRCPALRVRAASRVLARLYDTGCIAFHPPG